MTSERAYSAAMSQSAACDELRRCAGEQFDSAVVEAFIAALAPPAQPASSISQRSPVLTSFR